MSRQKLQHSRSSLVFIGVCAFAIAYVVYWTVIGYWLLGPAFLP